MKVQLILEGGGMRGVYTAGVLDYLIENNLKFLNVIGVSAGACNAVSYRSWQYKRNIDVYLNYSHDKRYLSFRSLIKSGNIFGFDFIFDIIPNQLVLFDYNSYKNSKMKVEAVVTNLETGEPEYYLIEDINKQLPYLRASSSIPLVSKTVIINGKKYLDGGVSDSIPVEYSIESKFDLHVIILTRSIDYQKKKMKSMRLFKARYYRYPKFVETFKTRHIKYNRNLELISELEEKKKAFVVRPTKKVTISRLEKDKHKLEELYNLGYNDMKNKFNELLEFVKDADNVEKKDDLLQK